MSLSIEARDVSQAPGVAYRIQDGYDSRSKSLDLLSKRFIVLAAGDQGLHGLCCEIQDTKLSLP